MASNSLAPGVPGGDRYPRFDTWKFQDSFMGARGDALDRFNLGGYIRKFNPNNEFPPAFGDVPGTYFGDQGTKFSPHVSADPIPVPHPDWNSGAGVKKSINPAFDVAFAPAPPVVRTARGKGGGGNGIMAVRQPVVARRKPGGGGISLSGMAGRGGGGGGGVNANFRNTPGIQTLGIYPQTGAQQDYNLHNPNSYTYAPNR